MTHPMLDIRRAVVRPVRMTQRMLAKERTRARVLEAARSMFAERGYERATIRDIAGAAELSTGAVFASFADKAELFDEIMLADYDTAVAAMQSAADAAEGTTVDVVVAAFRAAYAVYIEQLPVVRTGLAHTWASDRAADLFQRGALERVTKVIQEILQRGVDDGELSKDTDVRLVSEVLWDAYLGNYRLAVFGRFDLDDLTARVRAQAETILCGFLRR